MTLLDVLLLSVPFLFAVPYFEITQRSCFVCGRMRGAETAPPVMEYTSKISYHENCLREVLNHPEQHGNEAVDMAIDIVDRLNYLKKTRDKKIQAARERAKA